MLSQGDTFAGDDPTSIILKDPYPEHTRNGLSRAAYSVLKMYTSLSLPKQVAEIMASSLFAGLEVLKQISYSATESLNDLYEEYSKSNLALRRRQPVPSTNLTAVPSTHEAALTPELFEEATFRQLDLAGEDPFLINKTIGRHETNEQADDFAWFDLDGADLEWMNQDWSFEVSKALRSTSASRRLTLRSGLFLKRIREKMSAFGGPFYLTHRIRVSEYCFAILDTRGLGSEPQSCGNGCHAIGSQPNVGEACSPDR